MPEAFRAHCSTRPACRRLPTEAAHGRNSRSRPFPARRCLARHRHRRLRSGALHRSIDLRLRRRRRCLIRRLRCLNRSTRLRQPRPVLRTPHPRRPLMQPAPSRRSRLRIQNQPRPSSNPIRTKRLPSSPSPARARSVMASPGPTAETFRHQHLPTQSSTRNPSLDSGTRPPRPRRLHLETLGRRRVRGHRLQNRRPIPIRTRLAATHARWRPTTNSMTTPRSWDCPTRPVQPVRPDRSDAPESAGAMGSRRRDRFLLDRSAPRRSDPRASPRPPPDRSRIPLP